MTATKYQHELGLEEMRRKLMAANVMPDDFSDSGNEHTFILNVGDSLRFCDALGWLHWTGNVWKPDKHAAFQTAMDFTELMRQDAISVYSNALYRAADAEVKYRDSGDERDKRELENAKREVDVARQYLAHAQKSRNGNRIAAMLELASHDRAIIKDVSEFDAHWDLLNRPDGFTDLKTGETFYNTEQFDSKHKYFTKQTAVKASSHGKEIWERFVDTVTCGDKDLAVYLQAICGAALFGRVFEEGVFFCIGSGRNAKSTFWNVVQAVSGDYAGGLDVDILLTGNQNKKAEIATLRGKRLIVCGELEEGRRLSISTLKRLASTDAIRGEEKYKAPFDFVPSHTLVIFSNHLPKVRSSDDGSWRRLHVVPFNARIGTETAIPNYADWLVEHAGEAALRWCIAGAVQFAQNGYKLPPEPEAVRRATGDYRQREDWLARFIAKMCVIEDNAQERLTDLYGVYRDWIEAEGEDRVKKRVFSDRLADAGFRRTERSRVVMFHGIRLDY